MLSKIILSILLATVFLSTVGVNAVLAQANSKATEIRARVNKYGVGKKVSVTLTDGVKYKGRIKKINQDDFSVEIRKSTQTKTFSYDDVKKIKKSSYAKWIIIGAGIAGAVIVSAIAATSICRGTLFLTKMRMEMTILPGKSYAEDLFFFASSAT